MRRKAQVFTLDVLIALLILIIGISIVYYHFPNKTKSYYTTERLSEDVIAVLSETKISDLCINPGTDITQGCSCETYQKLETAVCKPYIKSKDVDILSFFTEVINNGYLDRDAIYSIIHEIFIEKNVIDDKRFGFAIIYSTSSMTPPLEIYNTDVYYATHQQ